MSPMVPMKRRSANASKESSSSLRNKDGTWDAYAKAKYEVFKKLHDDEIVKNGVDNLTVEEAYMKVLNESFGYIKGLGAGPRYPKKGRNEEQSSDLSDERHSQLTQQIDHLQQESANREAALRAEIDRMRAEAMKKEQEAKQREQEAREREQEARDRENKLQEEVSLMKGQLTQLLEAFKASQAGSR